MPRQGVAVPGVQPGSVGRPVDAVSDLAMDVGAAAAVGDEGAVGAAVAAGGTG